MSCISRRMCARVCLLPCSTCQKRPKIGRKQGQTCYQWASGRSFTQTALMMMMMMTTTMMMMMSHRRTRKVVAKAKRPRSRANIITAPRVLHSKSEGDPAIYQLPPRNKTSLRFRWEDQQIPRLSEAEVQQDEVSRLSRADDASTSGCNARDHGRPRP